MPALSRSPKPNAKQDPKQGKATGPKESFAIYERSGPTLLAAQPNALPNKSKPDASSVKGISSEDWKVLRNHLEGEVGSLRTWRDTWWIQNWSDLARFLLPRRSIWLTQSAGGLPSPNTMTRGLEINESIVDPTGTFALRVCAGGIMSGLASPSRPWFKIIPSIRGVNIDSEAREWLDSVEDIVYTVLARSNFYDSFAQECEDIVVYGTAPCIIYEDEKDIVRCYNPAVGEYYLSSGATLRVNGIFRIFVMTISQMVDFFGLEACPPEIQSLWKEKGGAIATERLIAHSIEPNYTVQGKGVGKVKGDYTWREVFWMYGTGTTMPLSFRGFIDQPFTAARWATQSNDAYGRSPGMDVLPDVMQLQIETRRKAEGIEKGLRPPLLADMELKNSPSSQLPGHVTYVANMSAGKGMRSIYETNFDLEHVSQDLAQIQARIKSGLFNDLFLMLESMPEERRTATEIQAKLVEKMNVLGPVIERLLAESLQPKLRRIFGILQRRGMIPPVPKSLQGVPLDLQFVSLLALAQKAASTGGMEALVKMAGALAPIFPEVADNVDSDEFLREYNDLLGNKQKTLRGPEQVQAIRQQRQQQQQATQQAAMMAHGVQTANTGAAAAQTLANTPVGSGGSALDQLLGVGAGGTQRL